MGRNSVFGRAFEGSGFPLELDTGKNKGVKIGEVKGRGCSASGKMKRSTNPAQDRGDKQEN